MMENDKTNMELQQMPPVSVMNQTKSSATRSCLKTNLLTILTVGGVICGGLLGFLLRQFAQKEWTEREVMYINFPGDLFLRMLKSLILPLIVSSLVSAIARLDVTLSGKIATRAIGYYLTTTVCAVIIGIILVITIQPGKMGDKGSHNPQGPSNTRNVTTVDTLLDLVRNLFPPNLVQACTQQTRTVLLPPTDGAGDIKKWKIQQEYTDGTNILGLVVFSTVMGIILAKLGEKGEHLTKCFETLSDAMLIITRWVIYLSPVGVMFLVASKVLEIENPDELIERLGMYFLTVIVGLLIQGLIVIPITYLALTRKNPFTYAVNLGQALATAFGTSSSSATLPLTLKCVVENNGVDSRVAKFALPIGATINMDGTALYEAVAAIFIAQIRNVNLSIGNLVAVSITATVASIGAAGIPQAGLVTMVMVLDTVGLPAEDVTLIIAIDWLLDRFRTVLNVMGDAFGAGIVYHLSKEKLTASSISNHL